MNTVWVIDYDNEQWRDIKYEGDLPASLAQAFAISIQKWEQTVKLLERGLRVTDGGPSTCGLCLKFKPNAYHGCGQCPVAKKTGKNFCEGTPYEEWAQANSLGSELAAARKELRFLKRLRKS